MKKSDFIIIIIVIILAIGIYYGNILMNSDYDEKYIEIYVDDELIYSSLFNDELEEEIIIDNEYGYNLIIINNGMVDMIESDCPDQVCVNAKKISNPGESIVCLPNKLIIQIIGQEEDGVDAISN